jgi:hypothetical protein
MKAWSALGQLSVLAGPATIGRGAGPGLNYQTSSLLAAWNRAGVFNTSQAKIHFVNERGQTDAGADALARDQVLLETRLIYTDDGQPRSVAEITEQVFIAWVLRPWLKDALARDGISEDRVRAIAHELTRGLDVNERSLNGERWTLHFLNWRDLNDDSWASHSVWVSLETAYETFDLRSPIMMALPCPSAEYFGPRILTEISGEHLVQNSVLARIKWNCGPRSYSGRLMIEPSLQIDGSRFNVSQVEEVASCAKLLGQ